MLKSACILKRNLEPEETCCHLDFIVIDRLLITQTKTKQTNPIPKKNDGLLMSSASSIQELYYSAQNVFL